MTYDKRISHNNKPSKRNVIQLITLHLKDKKTKKPTKTQKNKTKTKQVPRELTLKT